MSRDQNATSRMIVPLQKGELIRSSESLAQRGLRDIARIEGKLKCIFDAVATGDADRVRIILQSDATQANAKDSRGWTILRWAAKLGNLSIVRLLLDSGANINTDNIDPGTPALVTATIHGHTEIVALLLDQGVDIHKTYHQRGETLLHSAAYWGSADLVKMLVARGAEVNAADAKGLTPLIHATKAANLDSAKALIDAGARLDLFSAATLGLSDAVNEIAISPTLANAPMNDYFGSTPLHFAATHGQVTVARLLLLKKNDVNSRDNHGSTPLHRAAAQGHLDVVQLLMQEGADPNAAADNGRTPLHWAARDNRIAVVRYLIANGAQWQAQDEDGKTAFDEAAEEGYGDVSALLRECQRFPKG